MKKDIGLYGASRRDFIKGVFAASAALGVGPLRALEVLDQMGGSALAADGCANVTRTVNLVAGTGGLAWFSLVWPLPRVIGEYQKGYAYDDPSKAAKIQGIPEGRQLYARQFDPAKPPLWENFGAKKRVSAILTTENGSHEVAPQLDGNSNTMKGGVGGPIQLFAAMASMQQPLQTLVPVINIRSGNVAMPYGRSPGAVPPPASVADANSMVGLFSSAASRLAGRLDSTRNQMLFDRYYKAFLSLAKTANVATYQRAYGDSKVAVSLLSQNLGAQLAPDPAKVQAWCGGAMPYTVRGGKVGDMAAALMVISNAFKLGLTGNVTFPVFNDDPHFAFSQDRTNVTVVADATARVLQAFMDDLDTTKDPACSSKSLADNLVFTVSGDLPKNSFKGDGGGDGSTFGGSDWADATPGGSNWIYVMSNGWIKPGWHGDVTRAGKTHENGRTGQLDQAVTGQMGTDAALAAVLYAVAQGDGRRVNDYYTGDYQAYVNTAIMG